MENISSPNSQSTPSVAPNHHSNDFQTEETNLAAHHHSRAIDTRSERDPLHAVATLADIPVDLHRDPHPIEDTIVKVNLLGEAGAEVLCHTDKITRRPDSSHRTEEGRDRRQHLDTIEVGRDPGHRRATGKGILAVRRTIGVEEKAMIDNKENEAVDLLREDAVHIDVAPPGVAARVVVVTADHTRIHRHHHHGGEAEAAILGAAVVRILNPEEAAGVVQGRRRRCIPSIHLSKIYYAVELCIMIIMSSSGGGY